MSIPKPEKIPQNPGVYIFLRGRTPIYIGKASDLKKRLDSYWRKNTAEKVRLMMQEATGLKWIELSSDIEALLKEAESIKKLRPKYNILMRDDKNYFYVGFTREKFPRVFITHQPRPTIKPERRGSDRSVGASFIGPFTSGTALYSTLRLLRRIFPYCTCKGFHKRPCLNSEIGRCLNYCCNPVNQGPGIKERDEYAKNIRNIRNILEGKRLRILSGLKKEMKTSAIRQDFEQAAKLRDQVWGLENIFSHRRLLEVRPPARGRTSAKWHKIALSIRNLLNMKKSPIRVEGYDISNISGTEATGSMVVFINGRPAKTEYRKFRIKTVEGANDIAMHREVISRRLNHAEWEFPELMLIDGGRPQLNAALSAFGPKKRTIPVAALAKKEEELYTENKQEPIALKTVPRDVLHFFQHVRDESHRFAKKYHHKLREMSYRSK